MTHVSINGVCTVKEHEFKINSKNVRINPVDTGRKLKVHKTFRRHAGRLIYVQFTCCVYRERYDADMRVTIL